MTPEEAHAMKYDLMHDLAHAPRITHPGVTQPGVTAGAARAAIPGGAARTTPAPHRYGEMLHPDDIAIEGRW